jgi:hypothetical protein
MHKWIFTSSSEGNTTNIYVVAVCEKCGVIRSGLVPSVRNERYIDLRGVCPGAPQEPQSQPTQIRSAGL